MRRISLILLILIFTCVSLYAQGNTGSKSLIHTQSGRTFNSGQFEIHADMNFFTKLAELVNKSGSNAQDFEANNYWLVNSGLALTYGISDHFDLTLAPGLYQDTHTKNGYNLPDDIRAYLKAGSFAFAQRHLYGALSLGVKFPIGEDHNYPFTYYSSGATEFGINTALSYYMDPYLPDRSFSAHVNVGWWNFNEAGQELREGLKATKNSSQLSYNFGLLYPTELFDFQLELSGATFLEQPDEFVFGREDWMYITPSVKIKPLSFASFIIGVDIRATGDDDESVGLPKYENIDLPNYSAWKAHLGVQLHILPLTSGTQSSAQVQKNQFNKRVEFFQQIIEDREKSENIKEEIEQLKEERESAEQELEELKQILEEDGN